MAKTARAVINGRTLNGQLTDDGQLVNVWVSNGPVLGMYRIARFDNQVLTNKSLESLFTPES